MIMIKILRLKKSKKLLACLFKVKRYPQVPQRNCNQKNIYYGNL